jgi:hypothetical protein
MATTLTPSASVPAPIVAFHGQAFTLGVCTAGYPLQRTHNPDRLVPRCRRQGLVLLRPGRCGPPLSRTV